MGLFLAAIGPGLISALVDNDAGGITTYSVAGSQYGYGLLWSLIPIMIVLIMVQEMVARMGAVTGKGLSDLIRENFGLKATFIVMVLVFIANLAVIISEFAGIAAASEIFGISRYLVVPLAAVAVWFTIVKCNYRQAEKIFIILSIFYVSYIISGFLSSPDWGSVGRELFRPAIAFSSGYFVLLIGIIGTTITPWMQFYLQSSIVEKGISIKDYKYSRMDVVLGPVFTALVAAFIIIACAATLYKAGISIASAGDAARSLEPLAGRWASVLFGFGLFIAALMGAFIIPLATSFQICEGLGWESGVSKRFEEAPQFYWILGILISIGAVVTLIPKITLIALMLASQVINGIVLPVILVFILLLVNNRKLMGHYTNSKVYNGVCWASIAGIIILAALFTITIIMGIA